MVGWVDLRVDGLLVVRVDRLVDGWLFNWFLVVI